MICTVKDEAAAATASVDNRTVAPGFGVTLCRARKATSSLSLDRKIYILRNVSDDFCYFARIELRDHNSYDVTVLVKQRAARVSTLNRGTYLDYAGVIPNA